MTDDATLTDPAGLVGHLTEQLTWHWTGQLRPRLDGLTDAEYLWEPVAGSWNVRPRQSDPDLPQPGSGDYTVDFAFDPPDPPPVTTIAWRVAHLIVGVFGLRNHSHFGGPPIDYDSYAYDGTADEALAQLDAGYQRWIDGISSLTLDELWTPVGPAEGPFASAPMLDLVLHIHREVLHHGAEIALLRDLYHHRSGGQISPDPS